MRNLLVTAICFSALIGGPALAHPGSEILTTSGGKRAAMSGGVTFAEENGVHVFRGGAAAAADELLGGSPPHHADHEEITVIKINARPFRSIRRLRTQGFYSGVSHPSRRYTQGFYSGPAGGR